MFGLQSYIEKIYDIQWYFKDIDKIQLQQYLNVSFKKENDYYVVDDIIYSPFDIVNALNDIDFTFIKTGQVLKLKIFDI